MARVYDYTVKGRGPFPTDMLRYDAAWPADAQSAASVGFHSPGVEYSVKLRSHNEPTLARWSSFMWSVTKDRF